MFTGIVEHVGTLEEVAPLTGGARLVVEAGPVAEGVRPGDSVSVCGACLTVTSVEGTRLRFDAVQETLDRTSLGDLSAGAAVNLERALRADGRLDGHIVQGHVDGTGTLEALRRDGEDVRLVVACGRELTDQLVPKGSVTVEGVSLTVCALEDGRFDVALIPHTLSHTNLATKQPGQRLNLEADVLGKYVKRHLERMDLDAGRDA